MSTINVGLVTTYRQPCGLATYAQYLVGELTDLNLTIFAEQSDSAGLGDTQTLRVWSRNLADYSQLEKAITDRQIGILHLNCHQRFFQFPQFSSLLQRLRSKGVKVLTTLHNPYTLSPELCELGQASDLLTVHTPENRLEVIANGIASQKVRVVEHGVIAPNQLSRHSARASLNLSQSAAVLVCFGFIQAHKGLDEVVQAVATLRSKTPDLHLYLVGGAHHEDPTSLDYLRQLQRLTLELGLSNHIHFIEGFIPEETVDKYLKAADAIVMNYRSQYYEASGALCRALASGNPVVTSTAPPFAHLGDAVFHVTSGFPLALAIDTVLTSAELRHALVDAAAKWCSNFSWTNVAQKYRELYSELMNTRQPSQIQSRAIMPHNLKILMKNRPNVFTNAGGDTIVMERTAQGLRELGCSVDIDIEDQKSPQDYDLVHLFNFATPQLTEEFARSAAQANVPFVVTTMYEDLPAFYNQMAVASEVLVDYLNHGQPAKQWNELSSRLHQVTPSPRFENSYTAAHAARLIATGDSEKTTLLRDYPQARVSTYRCGCDIVQFEDNGEHFKSQFGINNFVLCVGRLETRKNQLMLLKALEESNLTVVLATGGFTYQPDYERACRAFRRAGKTIFLDKLDRRLLVSAYRAARIHALPSWYELPGLVSMEAARASRNIVVCDNGTTRDYFGDKAFYCKPDDPTSIYQAVLGAYYCPPIPGISETVADCTWQAAAARYLEIYIEILQSSKSLASFPSRSAADSPHTTGTTAAIVQGMSGIRTSSQALIDTLAHVNPSALQDPALQGPAQVIDDAAKAHCDEGDDNASRNLLAEAKACYELARQRAPNWSRPMRSLGVIALAEQNFHEAESWFDRAISCDSSDGKAWAGKGNALWDLGRREEALGCYKRAIQEQPAELAFLPLLLKAAYGLERISEVASILRDYVARYPDNCAVRYCLAGALFKQNKLDEAKAEARAILSFSPAHADAKQLLEVIATRESSVSSPSDPSSTRWTTLSHATNHLDDLLDQLENTKHDKNYEMVIERTRELIDNQSMRPDQIAHALVLGGESLACLGQFPQAREWLGKAQPDATFGTRAHAGLGALALAENKLEEANENFNKALQLNEHNDIALAGLAHCRSAQGSHDEAWELYLAALAVNPENLRAILGVIEHGYQRHQLAQVEDALRNYLTYHPGDLGMIYSLAGCLYAQGRLEESRAETHSILSLYPKHEMALELLAEIKSKLEVNVRP